MKRALLIVAMMIITSCAPMQQRTGTISVAKFTLDPGANQNPIMISNEAIKNIQDSLEDHIIRNIKEDSKLTVVEGGCGKADYELRSSIVKLNAEQDHHYRVVFMTYSNKYSIDAQGVLFDCKQQKQVADFTRDKDGENVMELVAYIAEKAVKDIAFVPVPQEGI